MRQVFGGKHGYALNKEISKAFIGHCTIMVHCILQHPALHDSAGLCETLKCGILAIDQVRLVGRGQTSGMRFMNFLQVAQGPDYGWVVKQQVNCALFTFVRVWQRDGEPTICD